MRTRPSGAFATRLASDWALSALETTRALKALKALKVLKALSIGITAG
jgi:hypothetical protein